MSTSFDVIFKRFWNKVTDTDLGTLPTQNLESILIEFLQSAIVRFQKCNQDINTYDTVAQTFNVNLTQVEIEILAEWMKYEWVDQQIEREELVEQSMSPKDYAMYSQANHLDKMILLKQNLYNEINQMITDYSYSSGIEELR
jgi:hypothetical protein